ncbi:hypothetical protein C8A00DRAFT_13193 [Chaetomidium leptoderma]|uniref:Pentatricopeptide repeat-containing protein-mitochondrial domain-containing protein n=1 Tax=Chaetomidium leptoderma TaxID=669021 RepID=A0AAN6VQQ3_9PEZI|nr:hypothetical protein C8A00DRAFT_13193 [Chaetomidium leptoderma]
MSAKRLTIDALSRALCPSIDAKLLYKTVLWSSASARRVGTTREHGTKSPQECCAGQTRTAHTTSATREQSTRDQRFPQWSAPPRQRTRTRVHEKRIEPALAKQATAPVANAHTPTSTNPRRPIFGLNIPPQDVLAPNHHSDPINTTEQWDSDFDALDPQAQATGSAEATALCRSSLEKVDASTPVIYEALRLLRGSRDNGEKIRHLVKYLVEERGERPNTFLYEALVAANWDTTTGSADEHVDIYREMRTVGIEPSQGWYHSVLRLLAIHPDYLARNTMLQRMEAQGIELKDDGKYSVLLGLLREGQNEMALEYWDEVRQKVHRIPGWVFETFVYVLVMRGFIDEAVQLFRQRVDTAGADSNAVPLVVWYYLLDECSRSLHYEGTKFVWDKMVRPGTIDPADGIVLNVLNAASRHGDAALATTAIKLLSARKVKLGPHHYEPLLESYVQAGDLENAFRALCIMNETGVPPDQSSTRSIFAMLKSSPELADKAIGILGGLPNPPAAAINVLLEALAKTGDMAKPLDVYRQVCDLCQWGPNQQTFVLLLDECTEAEPAVFLVSEMDRFSVQPSPAILDSLIRCFAHDGNLDVALLYLDEMSRFANSSVWVSKRTLMTVLHRCYRGKDPRAWKVVGEAKKRGVEIEPEAMSKLAEVHVPEPEKMEEEEEKV